MKLSVYVPKDLEEPLRRQAADAELTPSRFIQSLLEEELRSGPKRFSDEFAALAGSWRDDRTTEEILADLRRRRLDAGRPPIR